jgi:hypothetical protein
MLQRIIDQPWISLGLVITMILLYAGASLRVRRDSRRRSRAIDDRRKELRPDADRRWQPRQPRG